jgi:hypothetical protein
MTRMTNERRSDLSRSTNQQTGDKHRLKGREKATTELIWQNKSARRKQTRNIVSYMCICEETNAHVRGVNDYSNSEIHNHKTKQYRHVHCVPQHGTEPIFQMSP